MKRVRAPLQAKGRLALARANGLSLHQYRQAMRVSNLPDEEFERLVESDNPPTVEQLANMGRSRRAGWDYSKPKAETCPHCGGTGKISRKK